LRKAIDEAETFCADQGLILADLEESEGFERSRFLEDAVNVLVTDDNTKQRFLDLVRRVNVLFKAILPDPSAGEFGVIRKLLLVTADAVRAEDPEIDISAFSGNIEKVLDESIFAAEYIISPTRPEDLIDLSQVDFAGFRSSSRPHRTRTRWSSASAPRWSVN
jgi:type I restriction enzyme R subunit